MFQLFMDKVKEKVRWAYLNTVRTVYLVFIKPTLKALSFIHRVIIFD